MNNSFGNCTQESIVEELFGSVSEFARQIEENGDNFIYQERIEIKYDETADIHYFYYLE